MFLRIVYLFGMPSRKPFLYFFFFLLLPVKYVCTNKAGKLNGNWGWLSLAVTVEPSSPLQRGILAAEQWRQKEEGGMLSVSEGRQINTTKHFGGGVNVSAGATLFNKGWCSLAYTDSYTQPHRDRDAYARCDTHRTHLESSWTSHIHKQKMGSERSKRLLLLNAVCTPQPPKLGLTGAFYIRADMEHQRLA